MTTGCPLSIYRCRLPSVLPERVELEDPYVAGNVEPPVTAKRHAGHAALEFSRAASRRSRDRPDPLPRFEGKDHHALGLLVIVGVKEGPGPIQRHVSNGADRPPFVVEDDPPDRGVDLEDLLGTRGGSTEGHGYGK